MQGIAQSTIAAACAHMVTTKDIHFPFHRQFTSDDEVKSMVNRSVNGMFSFVFVVFNLPLLPHDFRPST